VAVALCALPLNSAVLLKLFICPQCEADVKIRNVIFPVETVYDQLHEPFGHQQAWHKKK